MIDVVSTIIDRVGTCIASICANAQHSNHKLDQNQKFDFCIHFYTDVNLFNMKPNDYNYQYNLQIYVGSRPTHASLAAT